MASNYTDESSFAITVHQLQKCSVHLPQQAGATTELDIMLVYGIGRCIYTSYQEK